MTKKGRYVNVNYKNRFAFIVNVEIMETFI